MRLFSRFLFPCLSLIYRKATNFYMLILYPAILLDVFISHKGFLVESLEIFFFMHSIILSANRDVFTSSPIYLSYLITLTHKHSFY